MSAGRLRHINSFRAKGKLYHYFRRGGVRERMPGEPWSPEFMARFAELMRMTQPKPTMARHAYGTVGWLIADYKRSPKFTRLAPTTQVNYARMLDHLGQIGEFRIENVKRLHIQELRQDLLNTPRTADEFVKVSSLIFAHGVDLDIIVRNPAERISKYGTTKEYRAWTDAELALFRVRIDDDIFVTAFLLGLHTGQRREDVLRMTWSAYDGERITLRQGKTGAALSIPVHADLKAHLDSLPRKEIFILTTSNGAPLSKDAFSKRWRRAMRAAEMPKDLVFHGLRKSCARLMAEAGCTSQEIKSVTGHRTDAMVSHYTRQADQAHLAGAAIKKLEVASKSKK